MDLKEFGFKEINHALLAKTNTPYKIYAELLDSKAEQQFLDVLHEPYVRYGALMPDPHPGYSMPIGGVCATKDTVVPQFVGFDIGCGMCAYKTDYTKEQIEANADVMYEHIVEKIPLGFKTHKKAQALKIDLPKTDFAEHVLETSALKQLGTLGGGNHFIEVGYGKDEKAWIVIHSGSRGFGHKIASHYMLQAYLQKRNEKFKEHNPDGYKKALKQFREKQKLNIVKQSKLDNITEILPLDVHSELGQDYIKDQNFALAFALENRKRMILDIHDIMNEIIGGEFSFQEHDEVRFINRNHNHADYDESRGE